MEHCSILNGKEIRLGVCYYPEHWDKALWKEDLRRMKEAGLLILRIGEFAWNKIEPEEGKFTFDFFREFLDLAEEEGISIVYGTPTATPPVWLTEKYPEVLNADIDGHLYYPGARRHYNYNSPKYRELSKRVVTELGKAYGKHPAIIGWQIDNELNCEVDVFYSESDTKAFRSYLREKYHDSVEELNEAWGTVFWNQTVNSFEEIHVPQRTIHETVNPHLMLDYYRFISRSTLSFAAMQAEILRSYIKPEDFITTNGIFPHEDRHLLTRESLDFMTFDSYPNFPYCLEDYSAEDRLRDRRWSNLLAETRSISGCFGIMEQQTGANGWNTRMEAPTPRPGQITLWTMQSIAHGADFVSFFRWRTAVFGTEMYWHGILDYSGRDNRRLSEIKRIAEMVEKLKAVAGAGYEADVAVIKDYDNEFDSEIDRWHGRLSKESDEGLFSALTLTHTPFDYVYLPSTELEEGSAFASEYGKEMKEDVKNQLMRYHLVFYPHPMIMTKERAELLKEYVEKGGTLIVGCRAGLKDERGHAVSMKLPGLLSELLGTDVPEYGFLPPDEMPPVAEPNEYEAAVFVDELTAAGDGAAVLERWKGSHYGKIPAMVRNRVGEGRTYYYASTFTEDAVRRMLSLLHADEPLREIVEAPEEVELAIRRKGEERFLFALNFSSGDMVITLKCKAEDLFTGENKVGGIALRKYEAKVFRLSE